MLKELRDFASFFGLLCLLYFWQHPSSFTLLSPVGANEWIQLYGSLQQLQNR